MKKSLLMLACAMGLSLLAAPVANAASEYPNRQITVVVPYGPAGNNGTMARMMAPYLGEKLGCQVSVVNKPGAGTAVGLEYFLRQPADGYTLLLTTLSPAIANLVVKGVIKEDIYDKLAFINGQDYNPYMFVLPKNSPYKTVEEVFEKLKADPKSLSACTISGGGGHAGVLMLLDVWNLPHDNLRLVTYSSGEQVMTSVMGNQTDFGTLTAVITSRMTDSCRVIACLDTLPSPLFPDVPLINDVLKPLGKEIETIPGSMVGWAVHSELKTKYPDRYAKLVKVFEEVTNDPKVKEVMVKAKTGCNWMGPEATTKAVLDGYQVVKTNKYGNL